MVTIRQLEYDTQLLKVPDLQKENQLAKEKVRELQNELSVLDWYH